ncbi:glycosyltransferase family 4 protein [Patescibacteria group bacterium]|nr:glycosyltransferase family 4 protein [Patescibacteria group bacterium]
MKILQINKFFERRGGAEVYMHELSQELESRGHEVHFFATRSPRVETSKDQDFFVLRHNYDRKEGVKKDLAKAINFLWNKEAKKSLSEMLTQIRPDVIHLHNIYHHLSSSILSAIKKSGIPCVQTLHDYKLACPNYKMYTKGSACERCKGGKYYQAIKNQCLFPGMAPNILAAMEMYMTKISQSYERTVGTFICPSNFLKIKMQEWGEPDSKLVYLPNPVRVNKDLSPQRGSGSYLYLGRLYPEKGVENIIRAIARVPDVDLEIVGDGPDRYRLENLANTIAPGRVMFLGYRSGDDLQTLRKNAKALLVPSVWYENAPLSVLESMADGVPVIASDIGGLPELITDGLGGFLAKPGDVDSWIEAILQMENLSQEQRLAMGIEGQNFVYKNMNWDVHIKNLLEIYKK